MRTTALCLAALLGLPGVAAAQASVDIRFNIPAVLPRLVVVSPGVQVVPEIEEEVFFHDGWYWVRRDRDWYRSRNHRAGWVVVPVRTVPPRLVGLPPPGHYRNWKAEKEERKAERKAWKEHQREHRKDRRDDDHGDRGDHGKGHGKGRGHGRD